MAVTPLQKVVALLAKSKANAEGLSMWDISSQLGKCKKVTAEFVREACAAGLCKCVGRRTGTSISGTAMQTPVYQFKGKE